MSSLGVAARALALAGVWLSPAALLALPPLLLADGTRGLWPPLALAAGALLVALVLAPPWAAAPGGRIALPADLAGARWPEVAGASRLLDLLSAVTAFVFLLAQLAAAREAALALGWASGPAIALVAAAVLLAGAGEWHGVRVAAIGGAAAVIGLTVPLAAVMGVTDAVWPRVWDEAAARPRVLFADASPWTEEGRPLRGPAPDAVVAVADDLRVTLRGEATVRIELWEGGVVRREVRGDTDVVLRPGDRLVVPSGIAVRFPVGRPVPQGPASGAHWVDPAGARPGWRALVGLGVTLALGALGLAPVHAALPAADPAGGAGARGAAALVLVGLAAVTLWALYAVWLAPAVWVAGVAGVEVYDLPTLVRGLGAAGPPLGELTRLALWGGAVAAGAAAAVALARSARRYVGGNGGGVPVIALALAGAGALALAAPISAWGALVTAFGLAASTTAPAAVLLCWRERLRPRALAIGATLGLVFYLFLTGLGLGALGGAGDGSWLHWVAAWPALVAMPVNVLATWVAAAGPPPTPRSPLPPGFADLHARG